MTKKIVLARHGQGEGGARKVVQGKDDNLTEKGLLQAEQLAEYLLNYGIGQIAASPSNRTRQTADVVAKKLDLPVWLMEDLVEIDFGTMIGQPAAGLTIEQAMNMGGGEQPQDVFARVTRLWNELARMTWNGTLLVVSHRSILSAIDTVREGGSVRDFLVARNSNDGLDFGFWKEIEI